MNEPTPDEIEQIKAHLARVMAAMEAVPVSLNTLSAAITAQTACISRLIESNALLLQALAETTMDGEDMPPTTYMDGTPIR
jgi:hypothetical protein